MSGSEEGVDKPSLEIRKGDWPLSYPVSSPTLSIPRARIKSDVIGFDGEVQKSYTIPTPHHLIRPGFVEAEVGPGISNLFELAKVSTQGLIMNRRYTLVEAIKIKATAADSTSYDITVDCMLRPDSRDHIGGETAVVEFTGPAGSADEGKAMKLQIVVDFNYNTGEVTNAGVFILADDAELTYEYTGFKGSLKFTAKGSDKGRTITHLEQEMTDITIDPKFFIGIIKK